MEEIVSTSFRVDQLRTLPERIEEVSLLEKVALRVRFVNSPPGIDRKVESSQHDNQEESALFRLVPNCDQQARNQTTRTDHPFRPSSLTVEDETEEEENEENSTKELEVFLAILIVDPHRWHTDQVRLFSRESVRESHEESTDHGEVAKEEGEVENQAVSETLRDDNTEETDSSVEGVTFGDDQN